MKTDESLKHLSFMLKNIKNIFYYGYVLPYSFPGGSDGKASVCNVEDPGSIPGPGRSPGEGSGNPLQYSCLENSMDGGACWATQSMGLQRVRHD